MKIKSISLLLTIIAFVSVQAQDGQSQKMDFEKYDPVSTLVVPEHNLPRSRFPFIDVHNHQGSMPARIFPR